MAAAPEIIDFVSRGPKKSDVWDKFGFLGQNGEIDKSKVVCKECHLVIPYSGNTTNMRVHFVRKHRSEAGDIAMDGYGTKTVSPFNGQIKVESGYSSGFTGVRIKFESEPYQSEENETLEGYPPQYPPLEDSTRQSYGSYTQGSAYQYQQVHEQEFGVKPEFSVKNGHPPLAQEQTLGKYYDEFGSHGGMEPVVDNTDSLTTPKRPSAEDAVKKSQTTPVAASGQHVCDICQKEFRSNPSLRRHREIHSGQKKFSCELCGNCYTQKHNLTKHMRVHTGEKPYACGHCDKTFYINHHLKNHELQHTGQYPYTCTMCTHGFKHKSRLQEHMRTNHHVEGSTALSPPSISTSEDNSTSEVWDDRGNTDDGEDEEEMDTVEMDAAALDLLDDFDEDQKYDEHECEVCQQIFIDEASLEKHMKNHLVDSEFKCDDCSSIFFTQAHLMKHRKTHMDEMPFECVECNVSFRFKVSLHIHMRRHNNDSKRYECTLCNKYFLSKNSLKKHISSHAESKSYECDECDETFTVKADFNAHCKSHSAVSAADDAKDRVHPTCKTCGKTFSSNSSLRKHEYTHLEVKPHRCEECNVSFAQKIQLRLHNKRHNGGVMPPPSKPPYPTIRIKEIKPTENEVNDDDDSDEDSTDDGTEDKPVTMKIVVPERRTNPPRARRSKEVKAEPEPEEEEEESEDSDEEEEEEEESDEEEKAEESGKRKHRWEGYRYPVCPNCNMRFKKKLALTRHARRCKKKVQS